MIAEMQVSSALSSQHRTSTSVANAFVILDVLASEREDAPSLNNISHRLRMSQSAAHCHLTTLEGSATAGENKIGVCGVGAPVFGDTTLTEKTI